MTNTQFQRVLEDNQNLAHAEAIKQWIQGWLWGFGTASCLALLYIFWCLGGHLR